MNKKYLLTGLLCTIALQPLCTAAPFIPKVEKIKPARWIITGVLISSLAAYYKFKKPGAYEPLKNGDSCTKQVKNIVCRILGDFGKDEKMVRVNLQTGEVIYEKVDATGLAWVLKYLNKTILPIILAGGILMKNRSYIMKTCQAFYCTFEDPSKAVAAAATPVTTPAASTQQDSN
ncbi:MAG: hypothetical protein ACOYT8_05970 [Candidatus Dependentiae bacterium]